MTLEAKNITFSYDGVKNILENFDLSVETGEKVCIFAKSGYGKSTLAKILAGYEQPNQGTVLLDGKPLPAKGYCPVQLIYQHPERAVNPKWRIREILEESGEINQHLLHHLEINGDYLNKYPAEVSGGELQRICIARALQGQAKFLIADEITTMLDAITQVEIWDLVLNHMEGKGLIVITHNRHLAEKICDTIFDLEQMQVVWTRQP